MRIKKEYNKITLKYTLEIISFNLTLAYKSQRNYERKTMKKIELKSMTEISSGSYKQFLYIKHK